MGNLGRTDPGCADDGWDVRSTRSGGRGIDPIRTVLEAVAAPMAAVGSAGQVVHWNAAAARLFGRSAHEVAGRGLAHVVPANTSDASTLLVLLRAPVCGARRCVDIAIVGRDGREAVLETTVSPVASSELGPVAALVSFVDVTATRTGAAEEAPAAIAESCAEGIVYASLEGTVLMANAAVATMFGCSQADVIGRPLSSLHPPLQWAKLRDALAGARAGRSLAPELVGLRGDGSEFVTSSTLSPVQGADGRVRGVFAIVRDLSAGGSPRSGSALDALEMPAFSWAQAASAANVLIVGTTIVFASTAAVEMVGARDLAEVVGRDVFDFVAPTSKEATVARHESANAGRWPRQELITIKRVDGQEKQVEL
ncbi:MAG: hypothetical protein JWM12_65, partial [Ilumatobacteraceae bacterium]|nr:hypothetical protein [Ilumatobacteraceae bacterium]